jgi:hypothetical protein
MDTYEFDSYYVNQTKHVGQIIGLYKRLRW